MEDILSSIRRVIARDEAPGARAPRGSAANEDVLDLHEEEDAEPAPAIPTEEELVSAASAEAARQSLEALTAAVAPAPAAAPAAGGRTMEDVVLDALRPMLKDWLDDNLPAMGEAMVAKESSRITGKKF